MWRIPLGVFGKPFPRSRPKASRADKNLDSKWSRQRSPAGQPVGCYYYCNFAYSALACFRMGMSGSASFQMVRKS
jgi:hypothetical protein